MCIFAPDCLPIIRQPTHKCPLLSMSSDIGYSIPVSSITLHVKISPCSDKTWRECVLMSHNNVSCCCCYYITRIKLCSNIYLRMSCICPPKPPSLPTTTTQNDHRFYRTDMSFLSYVLYTEYCPLLFSVVHLEMTI